jgi:hypothetical protein
VIFVIVVVLLVLLLAGGGWGYNRGGPYVGGGIGIVGLLLIVLVVWLLFNYMR